MVKPCVPDDVLLIMASFSVTSVRLFGDMAVFDIVGSDLYKIRDFSKWTNRGWGSVGQLIKGEKWHIMTSTYVVVCVYGQWIRMIALQCYVYSVCLIHDQSIPILSFNTELCTSAQDFLASSPGHLSTPQRAWGPEYESIGLIVALFSPLYCLMSLLLKS